MAGEAEAPKVDELAEAIREIRDRVRARYPEGSHNGVFLPDLMPVLHARDVAQGKVAAIGSVNPRPPGLLNNAIQGVKRMMARALDWHVREQVQFNRAVVTSFDALLEALNENNRALAELGALIKQSRERTEQVRAELIESVKMGDTALKSDLDVRLQELDSEIYRRLGESESKLRQEAEAVHRDLGDLRTAWKQKTEGVDAELFRVEKDTLRAVAEIKPLLEFRLAQTSEAIQRRLWADLTRTREEFERLIATELRAIRLRAASQAAGTPASGALAPHDAQRFGLDWVMFAERFRGTEESVRERQARYVPLFKGRRAVVDLGCGRGEFLDLMKEAGTRARGVEASDEMVAICRGKQLEAEKSDLFEFLARQPDATLDGIFCAHVIEHLAAPALPELVRLASQKLERGGIIAFETPNPECLAIFAASFYLDPTHVRPVPRQLMAFYLEEAGFGQIESHNSAPAMESFPALASLPEDVREALFGGMDYGIVARKL